MPARQRQPLTPIGLIRNGLFAEYRFDDGGGAAVREARGGYHGTLGTGGSDQPDWATEGLDFVPGNNDVVVNTTMPDSLFLGAITALVVANIDTGSAFRGFAYKSAGAGGTNNPLEFRTDNAATPVLASIRANATTTRNWKNGATTIGGWRMYGLTYPDGLCESAPTFYVGTTPVAPTNDAGAATGACTGSGANLRIGLRADNFVKMDGKIAYLLLYNRALSGSEIAQNYAALGRILTKRGITLP